MRLYNGFYQFFTIFNVSMFDKNDRRDALNASYCVRLYDGGLLTSYKAVAERRWINHAVIAASISINSARVLPPKPGTGCAAPC